MQNVPGQALYAASRPAWTSERSRAFEPDRTGSRAALRPFLAQSALLVIVFLAGAGVMALSTAISGR